MPRRLANLIPQRCCTECTDSQADIMTLLKRTSVFRGRVVTLDLETVLLPNGSTAQLEIIHHPGGAAVVALDAQQRVCLLHQYRHAAGGWLWELPAGKIDNCEPPFDTAQRELLEEAGATARQWRSLGDYVSSPGVFTEIVHLFLARDLSCRAPQPEQHEVFEVHWKPFSEALQMATQGSLRDGKTLIGLFRAAALLDTDQQPLM
jgi:8-oxo-dGTP pyrophosphatase MutT (NUDIX family)